VFCQSDLGKVAYQQGEYHRAQQLFGENLAAWRALGDPHGLVCAAAASSAVYIASGQYDEARMLLQEALLTSSGQYDLWSLGNVLDQLGRIAYAQGQYAEADYLLRESIALFREIDDRWHVAQVINTLGHARLAVDQVAEARRCFQEALEIALAAHALPIVLEALVGLASISAQDAEPESAARVLAFVLEQPACSAQVRECAVAQKRELAASLPLEYALAAEQAAGALTVETAIELVREPDWVALSLGRHSLLAQCLG
jgi:tetratricopeptide (TPR) repeat protein